ncbi:MAG: PAS domain-containing sensor histidine kinase [Chloroflexota bacterium]
MASEIDYLDVVVEAALVGIYVIQDGLLRYVNPALAQMFGYQSEELVDKVHVLDLIHPEDREGVALLMRQRSAGELATVPHMARGISRQGRIIHFESLSRAVTFRGRSALVGTLVDVTTCVDARDEIEKHRRQLQRLSAQLIGTRETESKRISQALHDMIGQSLTAVSINLAQIKQDLPTDLPPDIWERLAESETLLANTLAQTRRLSLELRPAMLDELGLLPTLRWHIHRFGKRLNIRSTLQASSVKQRLSPELEIVLYRIVQEGLTNVARHAKASQVNVNLRCQEDQLKLTITDDGVGFNVQQAIRAENVDGRLGLLGMSERVSLFGGCLDIESDLGKGTQLKVTIPLQPRQS